MVRKVNQSHDQVILQNLLRAIRKENGMSQQELAHCLRKPQSFVSKFESGERRLDILEIRDVCQAVNIPFLSFIERLEQLLATDNVTR